MTSFKSPDRERFIALFASSISFLDREETRTWRVGTTTSFLNARVGATYYIMRENLIWRFFTIHQTAKFSGYMYTVIIL